MDYGKRFKHYRSISNLTQKEAADLIGIKDYQLGNYETNRSEPSLDILKKMSKVYQVSLDKLLGNTFLNKDENRGTEEKEYLDMDELLADLNDVVSKINKSSKK